MFERNASGTISTCITFGFVADPFPGDEWGDFSVIIVDSAIQALLRLLSDQSDYEDILFMEGPYSLRFSRSRPREIGVKGIKLLCPEVTLHEVTVTDFELVNNLTQSACTLLEWCRSEEWISFDEKQLEVDLSRLLAFQAETGK